MGGKGNGQQTCYFGSSNCWTPWASGSASCSPPNIGPDGFRIVAGSLRQAAFCGIGSYATAEIVNNLPYSWYLFWTGISHRQGFGTAAEYYAESDLRHCNGRHSGLRGCVRVKRKLLWMLGNSQNVNRPTNCPDRGCAPAPLTVAIVPYPPM